MVWLNRSLICLCGIGLAACSSGETPISNASVAEEVIETVEATDAPGYPLGEYVLVSARRASDVAAPPQPLSDIPLGSKIEIRSPTDIVMADASCDDWQMLGSNSPTIFPQEDPLLFDAALPANEGAKDHRHNITYEIICEGETVVKFLRVDDRVLIFPSQNGATNVILEKPLGTEATSLLQDRLSALGYYAGQATGTLNDETVEAIRTWFLSQEELAENVGVPARPAITENFLSRFDISTD